MTQTDPSAPNLSSSVRGLTYDVVVVGGGAAGLSTAASILKRRGGITVAIIEPSGSHFYQPGWTLVGGGVFKQSQTRRSEKKLIPAGADWVQAAATGFEPDSNLVHLSNGSSIRYSVLVVATGLTLDWDGIEGLSETLGRNGVTSNYRYDLAPYTWQLVQTLGRGNAVFTQPPMPIKCAGAPQKAMYLACDAWRRRGLADNINVSFHTATPGLFGVKEFVPALMEYIKRYHIDLHLKSRLTKVDGKNHVATFENVGEDGSKTTSETEFDMLHVVPPQRAPDVVRNSPLAGDGGWITDCP